MVTVDRQIHGYRQGHQLLVSSIQLPKDDQSIVDRLSDASGSLRPKERFDPYLTGYPLPSGGHYVLAKTWQDLTVTRAGCVRTLSLIIPSRAWGTAESLEPFFDILTDDDFPLTLEAQPVDVEFGTAKPLPAAPAFQANELLEALFLEDPRPIAVFDARSVDLVAIRLLTALWPSMRRRFAVSTFALSPRKVSGRDFDLVFAPKSARGKFSDWGGRRIDGASAMEARHRWTGAIARRVFDQPYPRLLEPRELSFVDAHDADIGSVAALRIALLWDELLEKVRSSPVAALGLLDIANSGRVRDSSALAELEPTLVDAIRRALVSLPEREAWDFLGAVVRKLQGRIMPHGRSSVVAAARDLAARAPEGAVRLLSESDPNRIVDDLLPYIASGIGEHFTDRSGKALLGAEPAVLGRLLAANASLSQHVADDRTLVQHLAEVLPGLEPPLISEVRAKLLPYFIEDWQLPAAKPLLDGLDGTALAEEIIHLGAVNDFAAFDMAGVVADRARRLGAKDLVRASVAGLPASERRDALLGRLLDPTVEDVRWLLHDGGLSIDVAATLAVQLLRRADERQLVAVVGADRIGTEVVRLLDASAPEVLRRAAFSDALPLPSFVHLIDMAMAKADAESRVALADRAVRLCIGARFGGDEVGRLASWLDTIGERIDGPRIAREGFDRGVDPVIVSRNMLALDQTTGRARFRVATSFAELAEALHRRRELDLDAAAVEAGARLMIEAEKVAPTAFLRGAGVLLPVLMRNRQRPVSPMVAVAFPAVYRELAKADEVPDLLKFIPFLDWDRCKAARQELAQAFIGSNWVPADLALTACRCNDLGKILRKTAKAYRGEQYLQRVAADLKRLPPPCRDATARTIKQIRSDWSAKMDWRD